MEGFLTKSNKTASSWKRRWFVLDGEKKQLKYYERPDAAKLKGLINLGDAKVILNPHPKAVTQYTFQVLSGSRTTHLCADSSEIMQRWFTAISDCITDGSNFLSHRHRKLQNGLVTTKPAQRQSSTPDHSSQSTMLQGQTEKSMESSHVAAVPSTESRTAVLVIENFYSDGAHLRVCIDKPQLDSISILQLKQKLCTTSR